MINVQGLTKYFHDFCAVDHVDFHIQQGEIVGLLGPNGAGKTTTLRILTGYLKPTSGSVKILDFDLMANPLGIKKRLGYLPESIPLYKTMLVYDFLLYVATIHGLVQPQLTDRMNEAVKVCGLRSVMHKPISELSKGFQQRLGLAHVLIHDPEILILDEPTSGLDPNQILEIRGLIREIGKKKTVILSTHILSEAEATCDRMMIIHNGGIVADGTPDSLKYQIDKQGSLNITLEKAQFSEVKSYLENIPGIYEIEKLPTEQNIPDSISLRIKGIGDVDMRRSVYAAIKEKDWTLLEMSLEKQSLENIFKDLTQEN
ncbi:MAG TPA: ATP-binding cassette domain-containing protein [Desulfohalobiaceae bacterium]|nr:ATP-binding cassette domain-containing protein [Desulfohalobiaceae bacterium]